MRILFINQFFWPDTAATSQYLTDLARFLVEQGHEVQVIAGQSSYAVEDIHGGTPPVVCHRVRCTPFVAGILGRMCSYVSFFAGALWAGIRAPAGDVIVTLTTPPMLPVLGTCGLTTLQPRAASLSAIPRKYANGPSFSNPRKRDKGQLRLWEQLRK